jgi:hypothetical protein
MSYASSTTDGLAIRSSASSLLQLVWNRVPLGAASRLRHSAFSVTSQLRYPPLSKFLSVAACNLAKFHQNRLSCPMFPGVA